MEILELQNKINKTVELLNNAKSISTARRYFVYLSGLISIYNNITGSDLMISEVNNKAIMKKKFYENFVDDVNRNNKIIYKMSDGILKARKDTGCEFRKLFLARTYDRKYLIELLEEFLASLGERFYSVYKEALKDERIFYNQPFSGGITVFDYSSLKSTVFIPYDQETVTFLMTAAHKFGHVFEFDYTKCSRKPILTNRFDVNIESFSMFVELLLLDFLRKINFNPNEVATMEEKYYNDFVIYAAEANFGVSVPSAYIGNDLSLILTDVDETSKCYDKFVEKYDFDYLPEDINYEDSINYMFGGLIATIYAYYYSQDKNFLKEIYKHFLDFEAYEVSESLSRIPYLEKELDGFPILKKRLSKIKTNQF